MIIWWLLLSITAWKVSKYGVFSGPYFPAFGLNMERTGVSLRIQAESGKILTKKTPYLDTFHAVNKVHHQPFLNKLPNNLKLLKEQFYLSKLNELVMNKNKNINYSSLQKKGWKNKNGFIIKNNRLIPFIVVTHQYCTDWWIVL